MLPNLPPPGRSSFGACVLNERLYVVGGHTNRTHHYAPDNFTDQGDVFALADRKWLPSPALPPRPRPSQGFALVGRGQYLYALGGLVHHEYRPGQSDEETYQSTAAIDRFDLSTGSWSTVGQLRQARSSYVAGVVGSTVYLLGGWYADPQVGPVGGRFLDTVEAFDLDTEQSVTTAFTLPAPLRRACAAVTVGGQVVVIGGLDSAGAPVSQVLRFNPASSSPWSEWPDLPHGTFAPGAGFDPAANAVHVFGGWSSGESNSAAVYRLNVADPSAWTAVRPMATARAFVQPVLVAPGVFGLLGGAVNPPESGQQSDLFEEYDV